MLKEPLVVSLSNHERLGFILLGILKTVPDSVAQLTCRQMARESQQALLHLQALKRMLDREEPGWSRR